MSKVAICCFAGTLAFWGGAIYKFCTTGVTLSPLFCAGIGACLLSCGIIKAFEKKRK